jgi:predicted glycoside hydrolase/deacetylase ChbG (UPF0249 family)
LSDGAPLADRARVSSLLGPDGSFFGAPPALLVRLAARKLVLREVETEWNAQIEKVKAAGILPTHVDGHKHVQMLPGLFSLAIRLAKKHGIGAIRVSHEASTLRSALQGAGESPGVRFKQGVQARGLKFLVRDARALAEHAGIGTADYFCGIAQTGVLSKEGLLQLLANLPEGTTELMCHPGYADADLERSATRLQESRKTELQILTDQEVRKTIAALGIRLINYEIVSVSGS